MRAHRLCAPWLIAVGLTGCPDPTTDTLLRADAQSSTDMRVADAAPDADAAAPDAQPDATVVDAALFDAAPLDAAVDAVVDAQVDLGPPDPCAIGDVDPQIQIGLPGADPFLAWDTPAGLPLTQLAQGGAVTRFDLLALYTGEQAEGITVSITDRMTEQELAFGQSGPTRLPCRPGVGRALVDRAVDYAVEFVSADLIGRQVRLVVTLMTPEGPVFGAVDGVLEAAE